VLDLKKLNCIYFLGIGGIGMSALARYFKSFGINVYGYDKTRTPLIDELLNEGIKIHFEENCDILPKNIDLVIYTPAIPLSHKELIYFKENKFNLKKRAEVLGQITEQFKTIAIAGTHGKTTITSIISHILSCANIPITSFIGGISKNINSNLLINKESKYIIVEADEYDRSFLTLHPDIAVISAMDADHLDIYKSKIYLDESFKLFAKQIKENGLLIHKSGLNLSNQKGKTRLTYHLKEKSDLFVSNISINKGKYIFDISGIHNISNIELGLPGLHNVENALAAIAVAKSIGIDDIVIKDALSTYQGVKRRFDYIINTEKFVYIDDYAHHPAEIKACILSIRDLFPNKKITGIFQPHLFTRTRDFADEFASSLELLDNLLLLDIYPARELPIDGINSQMLFNKIKLTNKQLVTKAEILSKLEAIKPEILLTMGAGDIDQLVKVIKQNYLN